MKKKSKILFKTIFISITHKLLKKWLQSHNYYEIDYKMMLKWELIKKFVYLYFYFL